MYVSYLSKIKHNCPPKFFKLVFREFSNLPGSTDQSRTNFLNFADEINSRKLKNFKFRGNRSIFVRTETLNTVVRIFARIAKAKLQNKNFSHSFESEND